MERQSDSKELCARALSDAMRDILREDSFFHMATNGDPDGIWEWNGTAWRRLAFIDKDKNWVEWSSAPAQP